MIFFNYNIYQVNKYQNLSNLTSDINKIINLKKLIQYFALFILTPPDHFFVSTSIVSSKIFRAKQLKNFHL